MLVALPTMSPSATSTAPFTSRVPNVDIPASPVAVTLHWKSWTVNAVPTHR